MKIIVLGIVAYLLFLLQRRMYERLWNKNLKVSVTFSQTAITEGEKGEIIQVIENRKRLPLTMLKVKFQTSRNLEFADQPGSVTSDQYYRSEIFQIGGGERITRKLTFTGKQRGYYHIKNIDLIGADLFLSSEMMESMTTNCYLYVYPKPFGSQEFRASLQKLSGEVLVRRHLLEDPFVYRGIREYQPFDEMRSVNWKATAKSGHLMVNQKNYTAMQTIRIFLNVEDSGIWKKAEAVEAAIQIAMGLTVCFLSQGIKVACYSNGKDILTGEAIAISGGAGSGQQDAIGKGLSRIDTKKDPWPFTKLFEDRIFQERQNVITLFVSPNGYEDFLALLQRCETEDLAYTWFYPYCEKEEPVVPKEIQNKVHFLQIRN